MATDAAPQPSFSRRRRWTIAFNVAGSILALLAIVVMANYLGHRYFARWHLSLRTQVELHPPTLGQLRSLTNNVDVTLYYSKNEPFYGDVAELLKEYSSQNSKVRIKMVDYERDPGQAQEIKAKYSLGSATNVIVFDCAGKVKVVDGNLLAEYTLEQIPGEEGRRRKPVKFKGEMMFTSALLAVTSAKPFKAYYLHGHGEPGMDDSSSEGYLTFAGIVRQNYIDLQPLSLIGTNDSVPDDCNLLIIAGPAVPFLKVELDKIEGYLNQGRRLFALFDARSAKRETGLEKILARWGVGVTNDLAVDPDNLVLTKEIVVNQFSRHPVVNPLFNSALYLTIPRPVFPLQLPAQAADAPKVVVLAATWTNAYLYSDPIRRPSQLPLMVAVDKPPVKGVASDGGTLRMIVTGDSFFLSNGQIEKYSNRHFVSLAANWLLDRTVLLEGLGPKPVVEYRLLIPKHQMRNLKWILLGAMPGGVLLIGVLIWLRRRR